jgi:adenylate kinase family enzyme
LLDKINKIAVLGISGAGKSTFARAIGQKTGLPVYHMDSLYWKPGWTETSVNEWEAQEKDILSRDRWIVEGWIDRAHPQRIQQADLAIYLDFSGVVCAFNAIKRWRQYRDIPRPELPERCDEQIALSTLWKIMARKERPDIEHALAAADSVPLIRLTSIKVMKQFLIQY